MNDLDACLYNTRKTVLEATTELGYNIYSEVTITLKCCNDCGIWLKTMIKDLDGNDICQACADTYGL